MRIDGMRIVDFGGEPVRMDHDRLSLLGFEPYKVDDVDRWRIQSELGVDVHVWPVFLPAMGRDIIGWAIGNTPLPDVNRPATWSAVISLLAALNFRVADEIVDIARWVPESGERMPELYFYRKRGNQAWHRGEESRQRHQITGVYATYEYARPRT